MDVTWLFKALIKYILNTRLAQLKSSRPEDYTCSAAEEIIDHSDVA